MLKYFYTLLVIIVKMCYLNTKTISGYCSDNAEVLPKMPKYWPCEWNLGVIPYAFDFYVLNKLQLIRSVKQSHKYLEAHSCLVFEEHNPIVLAKMVNFTHLYYHYSDAIESCCAPLYMSPRGRRNVLITPMCSTPTAIAHAILHALGMKHARQRPFDLKEAERVLFINNCTKKYTNTQHNIQRTCQLCRALWQ